jgi:hypothetical protein
LRGRSVARGYEDIRRHDPFRGNLAGVYLVTWIGFTGHLAALFHARRSCLNRASGSDAGRLVSMLDHESHLTGLHIVPEKTDASRRPGDPSVTS